MTINYNIHKFVTTDYSEQEVQELTSVLAILQNLEKKFSEQITLAKDFFNKEYGTRAQAENAGYGGDWYDSRLKFLSPFVTAQRIKNRTIIDAVQSPKVKAEIQDVFYWLNFSKLEADADSRANSIWTTTDFTARGASLLSELSR